MGPLGGGGCPRAFLTDNGKEFDNELLRDLKKLFKVRHGFTPPYHPQGNYTERLNRCVGEWLRALINTKTAGKRGLGDVQYTSRVEFAYSYMFIPGRNISPFIASTGRQPLVMLDDAVSKRAAFMRFEVMMEVFCGLVCLIQVIGIIDTALATFDAFSEDAGNQLKCSPENSFWEDGWQFQSRR